jgi:hypothetical protein
MSNTKNNDQSSPGTSDRGQLTASVTPYLPPQPPQPEYTPPPRPQPVKGAELTPQVNALKSEYRAYSAAVQGFADVDPRTNVPRSFANVPSDTGIPRK